jgi:aspartate dehydrogenase
MVKKLKIGIVGCGAIGGSLAKFIKKDFKAKAELSGLFDIDEGKAYRLAAIFKDKNLVLKNLENLMKKSELVIEATHAKYAYQIAKKALDANCDIMVMSVGGLIDKYKKLSILAKRKGRKVYIPSGAICGLDGLKAASAVKINKVTLTTIKPPQGFGLKGLKKEKIIFSGNAQDAVKDYPQNINVAATLSIAGIGPKRTQVRIIASPKVKRNIHNVEILSSAGKITAITENVAHPGNPKTSYLAVLSAIATLKQIPESVKIGT